MNSMERFAITWLNNEIVEYFKTLAGSQSLLQAVLNIYSQNRSVIICNSQAAATDSQLSVLTAKLQPMQD